MKQSSAHIALVVREYDEAINFFSLRADYLDAGSTDVPEHATGLLGVNYTNHGILYCPIGDATTMAGVPRSL